MKKTLVFLLAGFAAGVAFVAACGSSGGVSTSIGPGNAAAQAACSQYEVQAIDKALIVGEIKKLPTGWVPFSTEGSAVVLFRCAQ